MNKARYLEKSIAELCFASHKMAFIAGPRQGGKTTMAKHLLQKRAFGNYYNWDETKFRRLWSKDPAQIINANLPTAKNKRKTKPLIILDEIHKAKLWKRSLKGVYDTFNHACDILVTGSARLNVYRRGSDSLMGRYYHFRLHPFSLAELLTKKVVIPQEKLLTHLFSRSQFATAKTAKKYFRDLDKFGPFPEPLFAKNKRKLNLWQRGRTEKIVREDLRDLSHLPELSQIEMLTALLPERAANILSIKSLSEDLEVAYTTIKRWLNYLDELYYIFTIPPYFKSLPRALKKERKIYLWDWSEIEEKGARFENLVACHLLKYCHYLTDTGEGIFELRYLRNKERKEIDFLILKNKKPWLPLEVKLRDHALSENWPFFMKHLTCEYGIQVVKEEGIYKIHKTPFGKILVISASQLLSFLV